MFSKRKMQFFVCIAIVEIIRLKNGKDPGTNGVGRNVRRRKIDTEVNLFVI